MRVQSTVVSVVSVGFLFLAGCGDDSAPAQTTGCNTEADCPGDQQCFENQCVAPAPADVPDVQDTNDDGPTPDPGKPSDPGKPFDPGPQPDLIPDNEPPVVQKTDPADGTFEVALPVTITITFSEVVANVEKNTVTMTDIDGNTIEGTFAVGPGCEGNNGKCQVHTFTPKADSVVHGSPYKLSINFPTQVILDSAGNKMEGIHEVTFYTAVPANLGKYDALAKKYAPQLKIGAEAAYPIKAQYELPTTLNVDNDWDLADNIAYLDDDKTKSLKPSVHYSVLESESHYFVHYVFYWSKRDNLFDETFVTNDAAGSLVVVEKWPEERPVEVLTWFKIGAHEYIRAFPTTESGIADGASNDSVDETFGQDELFPGGRYEAFLAAGRHHSCLWIDDGQDYGIIETCGLPPGEKGFFNVFDLTPGDIATSIQKNGANWPTAGAPPQGRGSDGR